jgi:hypothetical protein
MESDVVIVKIITSRFHSRRGGTCMSCGSGASMVAATAVYSDGTSGTVWSRTCSPRCMWNSPFPKGVPVESESVREYLGY